ncbi:MULTISPECIES: cytochrome c maturation protein CcmE [Limnochorda]|uniref:cytochrome c maturation protein CcmE n=1 Tax=Limnochorda TaxID=1676651 RepID=UPI00179721CA|nr:cytochrome c maturation protein CcmE [Limnochorda pilosa]NMA71291.1 cytochrome c maturation protein CcmE [Bacillota bacterium]
MNRKIRLAIVGALFVAALGYLISTAIANTGMYYYTVAEAVALRPELEGRFLRINGEVAPDTIQWDPVGMVLTFEVQEGGHRIPAVYHGARPDTFAAGAPIIVEGRWEASGTLVAEQLLMQCPAHYEPALPNA